MSRTLGAATVATAGLAAVAFVPSVGRSPAPAPALRGAQAAGARGSTSAPGTLAYAAPVVACLAVGAAAQRRSRVAAAAVLKKDGSGRYRFVTATAPAAVIVPSEQPGVCAPLGFFDPLGFVGKSPLMAFPDDPTGFNHMRESEIKHGRFGMMAAVGSVFAHYFKNPGFEGVPTGLAALKTDLGSTGFVLLIGAISLFEATNWKRNPIAPGSYGDPFKWDQNTKDMQTKEINNGRIAMVAIFGQIQAELWTGLDPVQQLGL